MLTVAQLCIVIHLLTKRLLLVAELPQKVKVLLQSLTRESESFIAELVKKVKVLEASVLAAFQPVASLQLSA